MPNIYSNRVLVIGDVHGVYDCLIELLGVCRYSPKVDRLIFLGDLVDRGPKSIEVLRFAQEVHAESVMGNHDDWYVRYARHKAKGSIPYQMAAKTEKVALFEQMSEDDLAWLAALPTTISLSDKLILVHGGFSWNRPWKDQPLKQVCRLREIDKDTGHMCRFISPTIRTPNSVLWNEVWNGPESVIYGHNVQSLTEVIINKNSLGGVCWGIDSGACFGGRLTAALVEDRQVREFFQVQATKSYGDWKQQVE